MVIIDKQFSVKSLAPPTIDRHFEKDFPLI